MKLISCSIENFGKLNEYERNFSEGITVFLERNAWGKARWRHLSRSCFSALPEKAKSFWRTGSVKNTVPGTRAPMEEKLSLKPAESVTFCSVPSVQRKRTTASSSTMRLPICLLRIFLRQYRRDIVRTG